MGHGLNKKIKLYVNTFFPKMVSVIIGKSYHAEVWSSVNVSGKFGFNSFFPVDTAAPNPITAAQTLYLASFSYSGSNSRRVVHL